LKTGVDVAQDVLQGTPVREAALKRVPDSIKRFASDHGLIDNQSGSGLNIKKRRRSKRLKSLASKTTGKNKTRGKKRKAKRKRGSKRSSKKRKIDILS